MVLSSTFTWKHTQAEGAPPPSLNGGVAEALGQATQEAVATLETLLWKETLQKVRQ